MVLDVEGEHRDHVHGWLAYPDLLKGFPRVLAGTVPMYSGRNHSSDQERGFLLISQRFDEDTRRLQGSVDTPI